MALSFSPTIDDNLFYSIAGSCKIGISRTSSTDKTHVKLDIYTFANYSTATIQDSVEFVQSGIVETFDINVSEVLKNRNIYQKYESSDSYSVVLGLAAQRKVVLTITVGAEVIFKTLYFFNNSNFNHEILSTSGGNLVPLYGERKSVPYDTEVFYINENYKIIDVPAFIRPNDASYVLSNVDVAISISSYKDGLGSLISNSAVAWRTSAGSQSVLVPIGLGNWGLTPETSDYIVVEVKYSVDGVVYCGRKMRFYTQYVDYAMNIQKVKYVGSYGLFKILNFSLNESKMNKKNTDVTLNNGSIYRLESEVTKSGTLTSFPILGKEYEFYEELLISPEIVLVDENNVETEIIITQKNLQKFIHNNQVIDKYTFEYQYKKRLEL